jgi:hypothetical protein
MAKIILGKTPKTFKPILVNFEMPDGTEGAILATFNYRTRTEYGAFLNQAMNDAVEEKDDKDDEQKKIDEAPKKPEVIDFEELFKKTKDKNADHLLLALSDWDLEGHELNIASLQQLVNEIPAASVAFMEAYRVACVEGRLGNSKP